MLSRSIIKKFNTEERTFLRDGAIYMGMLTGGVAYFNYRLYIRKQFYRSEGHYKFSSQAQNITPWKQLYFTWWRMPLEEFNVYHRFRPYFIIGQLDQSKEILIPKTKYIAGEKVAGYDVINPLYCYEGGKISFKKAFAK